MNVLANLSREDEKRIRKVSDRHSNWCTDRELIEEVAEGLPYVGDIVDGTVQSNPFRHQITAKLQDGRTMRVTVTFE